jgi:hypothetical protein
VAVSRAGSTLLTSLVAGAALLAGATLAASRGVAVSSAAPAASSSVPERGLASSVQDDADAFLTWPRDRAEALAKGTRAKDNAGKIWWDTRGTRTERSARYDVVATWMTPEVIRATARVLQLRTGLSAEATKALVAEAERPGETIVMIEIDPHEGSGVIPLDWQAYLRPYADEKGVEGAVAGTGTPRLRDMRALAGIERRNYAYDRFWMVFPLKNGDGRPLFGPQAAQAELIVRIYDKEARVAWPIPASFRSAAE